MGMLPLYIPGTSFFAPGYAGQCAQIDDRDWDPAPFLAGRPRASRFGGFLSVTPGGVVANATCAERYFWPWVCVWVVGRYQQILKGSFSAVSKPNFASTY